MTVNNGYHIRAFCKGQFYCNLLKCEHGLTSVFTTKESAGNLIFKRVGRIATVLEMISESGTWLIFGNFFGSDQAMAYSVSELDKIIHALSSAKGITIQATPQRTIELDIDVTQKVIN